jgi:hypothetical protein
MHVHFSFRVGSQMKTMAGASYASSVPVYARVVTLQHLYRPIELHDRSHASIIISIRARAASIVGVSVGSAACISAQ